MVIGVCTVQISIPMALSLKEKRQVVKSIVARSCTEAAPDELRQRVMFQIREVQVRITEV